MTRRERVQQIIANAPDWPTAKVRLAKWAGKPKKRRKRLRRWTTIRNVCASRAQHFRSRGQFIRARRWRNRRRWAGKRVQSIQARIDAARTLRVKPWEIDPDSAPDYLRQLRASGRFSPHFTMAEFSGRYRSELGTDVPPSLYPNAHRLAFALERLRHELGGPLPLGSVFRNPQHNSAVGGASQSRHMQGDAADIFSQVVNNYGSARFDATADRIFATGGFGRYPAGSRHVDTRPGRSRW